jgi:hypothetical protein
MKKEYIDEDGFLTEQYFLDHPDEYRRLLKKVGHLVRKTW